MRQGQNKAWLDWMVREQTPAKASCDTTALGRNLAFSKKYKITGTPTVFFANGTRVPGAIQRARLKSNSPTPQAKISTNWRG